MSAVPVQARRASTRGTRRPLQLVLIVLTCLAGLGAATPRDGIDEYLLKAAFLGKFVKYVTWPVERLAEKGTPFVVAVLGNDPFGVRLDDAFRDKLLEDHPIQVKRCKATSELAGTHLLFVPAEQMGHLDEILAATRGAGVLLVGEASEFAARGGMINFYVADGKLRFEINNESAKLQKLRVSSDLLKLARIVSSAR